MTTPRRGLSAAEAAAYIGLGQSKFLQLVAIGRMPRAISIDRRRIWDIRDLDVAFDALRAGETHALNLIDDDWGDATP